MALELRTHRFTVDEYYRMAEAGILTEKDRVELIEGEIVDMTPIGHRHALCVSLMTELFAVGFRDVAMVWAQNPLRLGQRSETQPDLTLLRRRPDLYATRPPTVGDVLLLIEVSDTTAESDRRVKVPLYSRTGVPEVWLADLEHGTITVYLDPTPDGYRAARVLRRGERVAPTAFPDRALAVSDLLPE